MRRLAVAVLAAAMLHSAAAGQQPAPQRAQGTLNEGVTAVLVDVVVRDRRGQPVRDLKPSDFEVLEDGVPQKIGSFTPVFEGARPPEAATPASLPDAAPTAIGAPLPAATGPNVIALVFDRLTPEARRLAVQAAQGYIGSREQTENFIGLFGIDLSLSNPVPFTRNAVELRRGLDQYGSRGSAAFKTPEFQQQRADAERRAGSAPAGGATPGGPGGPAAAAAAAAGGVEAQLANMQANILRGFEAMERDQQGYATTDGLFAIIQGLGRLPGRKSLVLFSEGVAIPDAVQRFYLGVIDAANRANVSIYAMDAAGLRAESTQAQIRDSVNAAAQYGINTGYAGDAAGGPLSKTLEQNEAVLRQDPHHGLGTLAQSTGGLVFDSTNNLRQGFERIEDDLNNYYLIGYTPTDGTFNGEFRTIDVRVNRPGVTVAARRGYFAVRDTGGRPINAWEAPALGALEQKPVPNAFPVRAGALLFPERGRPGLVPVVVEFPTAPLTFQPAADGSTYTSDFAVLVRFLDAQNRVTGRVSQHYAVTGPLDQMDGAKRGAVIFYRQPELPAGLYTMETVVYDALSGKASVRFMTVDVPQVSEGTLRMSSLVLVKGGETVEQGSGPANNPLVVNGVALRPNLGEPVSKSAKDVAFYFVVYPAAGAAAESSLELLQNGARLAQVPMLVGAPDASGRVQQVGRLPLDSLTPGTYELKAVVRQGNQQISRATMLRVVE